ncbi:hypothetical protein ACH5RR_003730 [Cinchona calisaya]|uniref:FAS1 domain-containing protein n=1 Tax=Cinchona calisaya TaxID=153742 RepID=A0ABD3AVP1_9GENT
MSPKTFTLVLLSLLCFLNFSSIQFTLSQSTLKIPHNHQLSEKLLNKGYGAMGVFDIEQFLNHLLTSTHSESTHNNSNNITAITFFAVTDKGFDSQNHIGIPTTLLKHQVIPFKVDRKTLESSPVGSTFPTLLANTPPLVKTQLPYTREVSINDVKIVDWEIYDDGEVIIHGVDDFFNHAVYPSIVAKQDLGYLHEVPSRSFLIAHLINVVLGSRIPSIVCDFIMASLPLVLLGLAYDEYRKSLNRQPRMGMLSCRQESRLA